MGSTGFQLFSVSGVAAYNHTVKGEANSFYLGVAQKDHHEVGFYLGIKDAASLIALNGGAKLFSVRIVNLLLVEDWLFLPQEIIISKETQRKISIWLQQMLEENYLQRLNIPRKTGNIFKVKNSELAFTIGKDGFTVSAEGKGQLLSKIDLVLKEFACSYKNDSVHRQFKWYAYSKEQGHIQLSRKIWEG